VTAITPTLIKQSFELTAGFYAANIHCKELVNFNKWLIGEMSPAAAHAAAPAAAIAEPAIADEVDFTEAVLSALKSSPKGVSTSDLRPILAHLGEPAINIAGALGRLKRGGKAEKRGDLWFAVAAAQQRVPKAPGAKAKNGKVDRSIGARRQAAGTAAGAGADSGAQQQVG